MKIPGEILKRLCWQVVQSDQPYPIGQGLLMTAIIIHDNRATAELER